MTGETENPGTYVAINVENNVNRSVYDKGKTSETKFTFKSNNPQDYNNLVADGKLTRDEVDEFMKRVDVSISEISSLYDANEDGELTPETLKHNALTGGDDKWSFRVKPKSGAKGYEDSGEIGNVFTGENDVYARCVPAEALKHASTVVSSGNLSRASSSSWNIEPSDAVNLRYENSE